MSTKRVFANQNTFDLFLHRFAKSNCNSLQINQLIECFDITQKRL